jgi:hypothetical protein
MLVLVGSAFAQKVQTTNPEPGFAATYNFSEKMNGIEVAPGFADYEDSVVWGNTLTLRGATSNFTLNINRGGIESNVESGNKVIGGTWSLTVYKGGEFKGMLFGEVTGGMIHWMTDRRGIIIAENLDTELVIKGGTGDFASVGGSQTFGRFNSSAPVNNANEVNVAVPGFPSHEGELNLLF